MAGPAGASAAGSGGPSASAASGTSRGGGTQGSAQIYSGGRYAAAVTGFPSDFKFPSSFREGYLKGRGQGEIAEHEMAVSDIRRAALKKGARRIGDEIQAADAGMLFLSESSLPKIPREHRTAPPAGRPQAGPAPLRGLSGAGPRADMPAPRSAVREIQRQNDRRPLELPPDEEEEARRRRILAEARAANQRGLAKLASGDRTGASREFGRAAELDPHDAEYSLNRAGAEKRR